jgi:hypothetical protein
MSTKTIIAVLILVGAFFALRYDHKVIAPTPIVCTQEAKQCPDGSYVSRTGPQCQFAACPEIVPKPVPSVSYGYVTGVVGVSPVCGVQTVPPRPGCDFGPYQTTILFTNTKGVVTKAISNTTGKYSIKLLPGKYSVHAQGGEVYPACPADTTVVVETNKTTTNDITCNSGIL